MEKYNLNDYLKLSTNEVVKVKLKSIREIVYGRIIRSSELAIKTKNLLHNSEALYYINIITDLNSYQKNKLDYSAFDLKAISSIEIEELQIVTI